MGDIFKLIAKSTCAISAMALLLSTTGASAAPPEVVTVPWRGGLDLPHEVYNGKAVHLKGVATAVAAGATATWDPGDGSGPIALVPNPDSSGYDFDLGAAHTYPNSSPGTPYTATLTVCNGAECDSDTYRIVVRTRTLDVEINIAIDEGLWYLHRTQRRDTSAEYCWVSRTYPGYYAGATASAVQAFQINNHFETGSAADDPYSRTVGDGLDCLFTLLAVDNRPGTDGTIWDTTPGSADSNGNGFGVGVNSGRPIYETGQVMDAIVTTKTPNEPVPTGPLAALSGTGPGGAYSYFDAVQDMVDQYAWAQDDSGYCDRGGWRYGWNYDSDNSAAQWAAIGILAARDLFGATVPADLYSENLNFWLAESARYSGGAAYAYGYSCSGTGRATTPSGLVQLVMDGIPKTDVTYWVSVEQYIADTWSSLYRDTNDVYALFALAKAMRLALPAPIIVAGTGPNAIDWFKADCANPDACTTATDRWGVARTLIRDQNADGMFGGSYRTRDWYRTAWSVIILTGTLRLEPVAVAAANPNPGADGVPINFDGSASFHQDPARTIVLYEWDFDNDNVTDATGVTASNAFTCSTLPCSFPVTLKVTDDGTPTPLVDTDTIIVEITNPPHPPTSDPNGPYMMCVDEEATFDGSGSFDIDEPLEDSITAYDWEFDFIAPFDFADASGVTPTYAFTAPGLKDVGLRVTDDSANIFGGPNLTDDGFTTAMVTPCDCMGPISVRAKDGKLQLVWSPVNGAASYDIYRSTTGPWSGFSLIADDHVTTYATYLDSGLTNGVTYWYRVMPHDESGEMMCGSEAASGAPAARTRRR